MTRVSNIYKESSELLLKNKVLAAIKKAITKTDKDSMVFERIQSDEEELFSTSPSSPMSSSEESTSQPEQIQEEEQQQPKYIFKRPMDKSTIRKMNALAQELGQLYSELKESAPIKRRRKITIYGL